MNIVDWFKARREHRRREYLAEKAQATLIQSLLRDTLREKRIGRMWSIFFRTLAATYVIFITFKLMPLLDPGSVGGGFGDRERYVSLVTMDGEISDDGEVDASTVVNNLKDAFEDDRSDGIILLANSPGGTPVQSAMIHDHIKALRAQHPGKKIYAVVSDICASGCYYAISSAERIYASPSSIVGSIGVRLDGFGFTGIMEKLGVERRLLTSGEHKALIDPFSPVDPVARSRLKTMLSDVHKQFIDAVREGRKGKITDDPDLFTGLVWDGREALEKGLVDELGDYINVALNEFGTTKFSVYTRRRPLLERIADRIGASLSASLSPSMQLKTMR